MRKASAAMVPLFLAIMTLFWFAYIMGGGADTLHRVNEIEDLQHLQERLLPAAMKKYIDEMQTDIEDEKDLSGEALLNAKRARAVKKAREDIKSIMFDNKVDDKRMFNE